MRKRKCGTWLLWLFGVWVLYVVLMPKTYPPRTLSTTDYLFLTLVPIGAVCSVKPGVSWRWLIYYAILGTVPFALELQYKLGVPYRIRSDALELDIVRGVYIPCAAFMMKSVVAIVLIGLIVQRINLSVSAPPAQRQTETPDSGSR